MYAGSRSGMFTFHFRKSVSSTHLHGRRCIETQKALLNLLKLSTLRVEKNLSISFSEGYMTSCQSHILRHIYILTFEYRPQRTHEALLDKKSGRSFATVTVIKESGHLVRVFPLLSPLLLYPTLSNSYLILFPQCRSHLRFQTYWVRCYMRTCEGVERF